MGGFFHFRRCVLITAQQPFCVCFPNPVFANPFTRSSIVHCPLFHYSCVVMDINTLRNKLTNVGQSHVLRFYDGLSPASREKLLGQLNSLNLETIAELTQTYVRNKPPIALPKDIQPVQAYPRV